VQNDHVFADAPFASLTCVGTQGQFLKENRTPFVGQADCGSFLNNDWGFGVTGAQDNANIQGNGVMKELIQLTDVPKPSDVKIAVIGEDVASGAAAEEALAGVARKLGATVVYSQAPVPLTPVTNFLPYAQAIVASGANAEFDALAIQDVVGLSAALKAAGYKGIISDGDAYFPGQLASNPSEESALNASDVIYQWPVAANNTPASKQQAKDLVAIGQSPDVSYGDSVGYWSADLLIAMLQATAAKYGASGVTPARMQKVSSSFTYKSSLKGGICPVSFPKSFGEPVSGYTSVQQRDANYVQKIPFECGNAVGVSTSS
jgi:hypothetical protein